MIIDTDKLVAECVEAYAATGEKYLSFNMEITISGHGRTDGKTSNTLIFTSYTPDTGHARNHTTAEAALIDTVKASADPHKLLALAAQKEEEARQLRARVKGGAA